MLIAVGVVGVSTSGPLIAAIAAPALAVALWRNALSLALLVPAVALRHRAEVAAVGRRTLLLGLLAGLLLAGHFALWVPSLSMTSVASATALVCTQAVWTAVLARLAGHHVPRRAWLGMAVALAGVLAVSGVDAALSREALLGDLLALGGGVFSGAYVVLGAEVRRHLSTTTYTAVCYGACAAVLLAVCLAAGVPLGGYAARDWWLLVALTVAAQMLGHSVFNLVVQRVSPVVVSLCILLEVPGAALLAALWLGQVPPAAAVPGMLLVLAGIAVVVRADPAAPEAPQG
ncbi:DMT family transporter [Vallicoccus soli]|uniref:DMT family transporter n=1 Tax=Vallicoccus soli TaxID=2339232 RepID=A0A3A3Z610_9ACTN|nr:DMT family transporter [Vallicoccus soli]